ncbi:MAG: HAD-IA family hydrolase [Actinomycetota bacterium]
MLIEIGAVLFDNDGVLVDSHAQVVEGWHDIAAAFGLDATTLIDEGCGVRSIDTLRRFVPADRLDEAVELHEKLELESAAETGTIPGAAELLTDLPDGRWTIVTSATHGLAAARWAGAGITPPPQVVTADEVTNGKPDPEPYLLGAERLGVPASDCVVFEDSPFGGEAARTAGAHVVAVGDEPWPFEPLTRVPDLTHVRVVDPAASGRVALRFTPGG